MTGDYCESCNARVPAPKHGIGIGGGWLYLCDSCAARVCACGAVVLPPGRNGVACGTYSESEGITGRPEMHGFHRCETYGDGGADFPPVSFTERGAGCSCDGCAANAAFDEIQRKAVQS